MSFAYTEEEQLIEESLTNYLSKSDSIAELRKLKNTQTHISKNIWDEINKMGLTGLIIDDEHGGAKLGARAACSVADVIGQTLTLVPFISTAIMAPTIIENHGTRTQKETWLIKLLESSDITAISIDNAALNLIKADDHYVVSGTLDYVPDGFIADYIIAKATLGNDTYLLRLPLGQSDISRTRHHSLDGRDFTKIEVTDCIISETEIIGMSPVSETQMQKFLSFGALIYAAELVGCSRSAFNMTLSYLKERKQFGRIIGSFQALQHRASILYIELSQAEALIIKAANFYDNDDPKTDRFCCLAKAKAGQAANLITNEAIQLHGGIGVTDEYDVGLYLKHVAVSEQLYGNCDHHTDKAAQIAGY